MFPESGDRAEDGGRLSSLYGQKKHYQSISTAISTFVCVSKEQVKRELRIGLGNVSGDADAEAALDPQWRSHEPQSVFPNVERRSTLAASRIYPHEVAFNSPTRTTELHTPTASSIGNLRVPLSARPPPLR